MIINVKVIPRAKKNEIIPGDDFFRIRLTAVPEKNKANQLLTKLIAEYFSIAKNKIKIISGNKTKNKKIEIIN